MKTPRLLPVLVCLAVAAAPLVLHAGTHTWSGAGANDLWSNAANWSAGGAPLASESAVKLIFPAGASAKDPIDNIPGLVVDQITLDGGGYTLHGQGGATLTLSGERGYNFITTNSGSGINRVQTSLPIVLAATSRFDTDYNLEILSVISGPGGLSSYGPLLLRGPAHNTYTGTTTAESSLLYLWKSANRNCFAGPLVVNGGAVHIEIDNQIPDDVSITLRDGADLYIGGFVETIGPLTLDWGYMHLDVGTSLLTLGGNVSATGLGGSLTGHFALGAATRTFDVAAGSKLHVDAVVSDLIGGAGGITKTGAGDLYLTGANVFTGPLTITDGICFAEHSSALGTAAGGVSVWAGATLWFAGGGTIAIGNETLSLAGTLYWGTDASWSGNIVLTGAEIVFDGGNTVNGPKVFTHTGIISGSGQLFKKGSSRLWLAGSAANTYSGGTLLQQGDLYLGKSTGNAIPGNVTNTGGWIILANSEQIADSASVTNGSTFDLGARTETIGSLAGATGEVKFALGKLITGGNNASTAFNGLLSGFGSTNIIKNGSGVFTLNNTYLSGGNTCTGAAVVNGGTLTLNGVHTCPVTVNAGELLNGSGTIGAVTVSGGKVCLCSLKTAGLTVTGASSQVLTDIQGVVGAVNYGQIKVTGAVNLTGSTFTPTLGYAPFAGASYLLIDNDGTDAVTGAFNGVAEGGTVLINGKTFSITYQGGTGNDVVLRFTGQGLAPPVITVFTSTAIVGPGTPMRHEHIEVLGPAGVLLQLQYSSDLKAWVHPNISGTPDAQGHLTLDFNYPDYSIYNFPLFYRVVVP